VSDEYVSRLRRVRDEHEAIAGALAYVDIYWDSQNIFAFPPLQASTRAIVRRATGELEAGFIIRLFSIFEGILKEHLSKNHPGLNVAEDASAAELIDRVATLQTPPIRDPLLGRVHGVRQYRNYLVHPGGLLPAYIASPEALARLAKYADRLPVPRS
jgi:hypothetical protein